MSILLLESFGGLSDSTIAGMQLNYTLRKETGSTRQIDDIIRSGGTNYSGAGSASGFFPGNSYEVFSSIHEQDPDTAAAWTESGVNSAEFGQEIA